MERRFFTEHVLAAYHEIVPDPSANATFLMRKLAAALFERGARIVIGEIQRPPEDTIYQSLDEHQRVVWVDRRWVAALGYAVTEAVGQPLAAFLAGDSAALFRDVLWPQLRREGRIGPVTATYVSKQGELLPATVRSDVIRDEYGAFVRTFAKIKVRLPLLHAAKLG